MTIRYSHNGGITFILYFSNAVCADVPSECEIDDGVDATCAPPNTLLTASCSGGTFEDVDPSGVRCFTADGGMRWEDVEIEGIVLSWYKLIQGNIMSLPVPSV